MSDRELRDILRGVIEEIDAGRLIPKLHARNLLRGMAPPAMAAMIALGSGCIMEYAAPAYGVPPIDAAVLVEAGVDSGSMEEYGIPPIDAEVTADASVDAGSMEDYGGPPVDGGTP